LSFPSILFSSFPVYPSSSITSPSSHPLYLSSSLRLHFLLFLLFFFSYIFLTFYFSPSLLSSCLFFRPTLLSSQGQ
jgi:hypothetical protein